MPEPLKWNEVAEGLCAPELDIIYETVLRMIEHLRTQAGVCGPYRVTFGATLDPVVAHLLVQRFHRSGIDLRIESPV